MNTFGIYIYRSATGKPEVFEYPSQVEAYNDAIRVAAQVASTHPNANWEIKPLSKGDK